MIGLDMKMIFKEDYANFLAFTYQVAFRSNAGVFRLFSLGGYSKGVLCVSKTIGEVVRVMKCWKVISKSRWSSP